jgi:hypothetical protein
VGVSSYRHDASSILLMARNHIDYGYNILRLDMPCTLQSARRFCRHVYDVSDVWAILLLVTLGEWYRAKRPMRLRQFSMYCAPHLSSYHSRFIHQSSLLWFSRDSSEAGRNLTRSVREFCLSVSLSYSQGSLTCRKSYDMGPTALLRPRRKSYC